MILKMSSDLPHFANGRDFGGRAAIHAALGDASSLQLPNKCFPKVVAFIPHIWHLAVASQGRSPSASENHLKLDIAAALGGHADLHVTASHTWDGRCHSDSLLGQDINIWKR